MNQPNNNKFSILLFLILSSSNIIILNVNAIDLICLEYDGLCDCELSNEYLIFDCSDKGLTEIPDFGHLEVNIYIQILILQLFFITQIIRLTPLSADTPGYFYSFTFFNISILASR